ncbi:hypothetical protein PspLS_11732 [Pyricularia sp. CBS 133598]|nr:hypothetical protein PspLS_11732 [Pyricularia sp. CBS 133598]
MSSSNPHQITAQRFITKLTAHIASPLSPVTDLVKEERAAIHEALSQWRSRTASARLWLAARYPDPGSIPQSLILGMSELEEDIDTLAFVAAHKALGILLDVAQVVVRSQTEIPAKTNARQPQLLVSSWDHTKAELLRRIEKQHDLNRLGKSMELFRRLVIKDYYSTTVTTVRARVDALKLGTCHLSPHPVSECPRLKLLGRAEQQLVGDIADAASHLWTEFADPAQLTARYQFDTRTDSVLVKDRQSEIFALLNGMVAEALDCTCDVKLGGAGNIRPVMTKWHKPRGQGWRFQLAVLVQHTMSSPLLRLMLRASLNAPKFGEKETFETAGNASVWHRVRAVIVGRGYRHAALLFAVAVLFNASLHIIVGGFLGNDPVADIRVALARPDLLWSETLETPLSSYVSFHLQFVSLVLTAKVAISGILTMYHPGSRSRGMSAMSEPFSDLLKVAFMVSILAIIQRGFCLAMQLVSLRIVLLTLHGGNPKDWMLLMAEDLTGPRPDPSYYFTAIQIIFCISTAATLFIILIMLVSKRRFALPTMVYATARCIWYAVGHRSVVYLPLEAANFFVAVGFAILGFLSLFEEFLWDPMRLEASCCLGIMSRNAALLAHKESEQPFALCEPPLPDSENCTTHSGNSTGHDGNSSVIIITNNNSTSNETEISTNNGSGISVSTSSGTTSSPSAATGDPSTPSLDRPKAVPSDIFRPPNPELFAPPGPDETCKTPTGGSIGPGVFCYCHGHVAFDKMVDAAIDEACSNWHNLTLYRSEQVTYVKRLNRSKPVYLWMINNCVRERREVVVDGDKCKAAMQTVRKTCQWPFWSQRGGHVTINIDYEIGMEPDKCIMARFDVEDQ